jgi:predicted AlkP superfamily phosphohydrolase/phosphomutase
MSKVIVFGLDGGTWDLIKPWADEGELPAFKKLMENGAWGVLESTIPPSTVPAWASMLTGKKPERLGAFYFTRRNKESYEPTLNRLIFDGAIWQVLNNFDKKSYIINVPSTEPPREGETRGVFIAGPIMNIGDITKDPRIKALMEETGYQKGFPQRPNRKDQEEDRLIEVVSRAKKQFDLVKKLLPESWDLLFYVNFLTDWVSHIYWKYLDETHPDHEDNEQIRSLIKSFYIEIDRFLDVLAGNTSNLFIVSDHGFGPLYREINLNAWLTREGFQVRRPEAKRGLTLPNPRSIDWLAFLTRIGSFSVIKPVAKRIAPLIIADYGKPTRRKPVYRKTVHEQAPVLEHIEWKKSRAYSIYYMGININLKGREPLGCVEPSEYEHVREDIIKRALQIRDEEGRQVVEGAHKVEEIYDNPPMIAFPDIVLKFKDMKYRNRDNINLGMNREIFTKFPDSGGHRMEGVFLAYGKGVKQGYKVESAKIYDLVPTILHVFGLPTPRYMDGRVLKEIFEEGSELDLREITYQDEKDESGRHRVREKVRGLKAQGRI